MRCDLRRETSAWEISTDTKLANSGTLKSSLVGFGKHRGTTKNYEHLLRGPVGEMHYFRVGKGS
jgi:hypothetical protein